MVKSLPKLAVITSHPIQYNAPVFRLIAERKRIHIKVFYTWSQASQAVFDPDFNQFRKWDIPLLEGYDHSFVENTAKQPGSHHFYGIKNPTLISEIDHWKPDAILVFGWAFQSHLACIRYYSGKIPVFFRGDSTLLDDKKMPKTWLRRVFLNWLYRHVDRAFYTGQNNRAYFRKHCVKEEQLKRALHAVDNERFAAVTAKNAAVALRTSLGFGEGDFVLLFAGKMEEKKNPFFLLQLAEKIKDKQFKFLLVGNGRLEAALKDAAKSDERIKFLHFQNQSAMPAVYHAADCFILPSKGPGETWGLAANEAMACGLPVLLSSKTGGAADLVRENGIIFKPDDVEKVAQYLMELETDPQKLAGAKKASLTRIKEFSFADIATTLEDELLEMTKASHALPSATLSSF